MAIAYVPLDLHQQLKQRFAPLQSPKRLAIDHALHRHRYRLNQHWCDMSYREQCFREDQVLTQVH
jgi:hypothetical protein